jgi:hypothetical protein
LRRLAMWGVSAGAALLIAVIAGYSNTPGKRLAAASANAAAPKGDAEPNQAARLSEIDTQTRRLTDAVRALTADRERLMARIDSLERGVGDLTGSIKGAAAAAAPAPAPAPSAVFSAAASPAPPPVAQKPAEAPHATPPAAAGPAEPQAGKASGPPVAANDPPAPEQLASAASAGPDGAEPPKTELGVDVGGAGNFEGLWALWTTTKATNKMLFDGLYPRVVVRNNSKSKAAELRLVVGPFPGIEAASRMCTALATARRYCQPVAFEGQRLAEADATSERKSEKPEKPEPKLEHRAEHRAAPKPSKPPPSNPPSILHWLR